MPDQCANCGFVNPPGMRFCGNCGSRLTDQVSESAPSVQSIQQQIGTMVGADLLERFRKAGLEARGQRRNVTVLFADISGYTSLANRMDNEDLFELVQRFSNLLANDVYKYDGIVDKFTGDGIMALFGAPIANENNAELAVFSGLDMLADVTQLNQDMRHLLDIPLLVRVGLNSGSVIVGGIGTNMLMNYTAIGDTVNMAQRLEEAAEPGTVLVSQSVYNQVRTQFDANSIFNLRLKGIPQPTTGYRILGRKAKPGSVRGIEGLRAPMVGRDAELKRLMGSIGSLATYQQGQFILVEGEAGLGKSRLIAELKTMTRQAPVTILEGFSLTYRRNVSYWIFQDLLQNYLHVTADSSPQEVREILGRLVNGCLQTRAREVLPFLEHLLGLPLSDAAAARRIDFMDASQLRQQIFIAIRDLLTAEAERRPLLIILEDLHWADEGSLELLQFLLDSTKSIPIMFLAVTRPFKQGALQRIVDWSIENLKDNFTTISLKSLSPDQSNELLNQLLVIPNLPERFLEQIIQKASGIPFYLEEILRMLIDQGVLQRVDSRWLLRKDADISSIGVPDTLQGLILNRFDRLVPEERRVLQIGSVIGNRFSLGVLTTVLHEQEQGDLEQSLNELIDRDFIQPQPDQTGVWYQFRHVIVSDAIYSTLLKSDRSELHGRVAQAIESIYQEKLESQIDLLARHYSWSPNKEQALKYLILAGQKAARRYLNDQAQQYYRDALALLPNIEHTLSQEIQVHIGLGDVFVLVGEFEQAREHYQIGLNRLGSGAGDENIIERSMLYRNIGTTYERMGNFEEALECLETSEKILEGAPERPGEKAQVLNDIGWIHFRRGDLDKAEGYLRTALELSRSTLLYDVTASILNRLGGVHYQKDQLDQASHYVRESLKLREEIGDTVAVARSYNNLGLLDWKRGHWEEALENFSRSVELNTSLGDIEAMIMLHNNMGLLQTDRGNMIEALNHLEFSLASAQQIGMSSRVGQVYLHLSRYWLTAKDWKQSLNYSELALTLFEELGSRENLVDIYASVGEAQLGLGNIPEALRAVEKAEVLLKETGFLGPTLEKGRILRLRGNIALQTGKYEQASRWLQESSSQFTLLDNQLELGRTLVAQALSARTNKNEIAAQIHLDEARLIFRRLGARLDLEGIDQLTAG